MKLRYRVALWAITASFPVLAVQLPRKARGLYGGRPCRAVRWVALCNVPLVGESLNRLAFRVLS